MFAGSLGTGKNQADHYRHLTKREKDVLEMLVAGESNNLNHRNVSRKWTLSITWTSLWLEKRHCARPSLLFMPMPYRKSNGSRLASVSP